MPHGKATFHNLGLEVQKHDVLIVTDSSPIVRTVSIPLHLLRKYESVTIRYMDIQRQLKELYDAAE